MECRVRAGRSSVVALGLLAALCAGVAGGCNGKQDGVSGTRPNVLLISIDTLRADHLSSYGYHRPTSPALDRLAGEGVLFEHAFSSTSWTLPAHAALFTGLPDSVHGVMLPSQSLADERRTLAEAFREAGFDTAGFWSGPLLHPRFGLGQGFDHYVDCTGYAAQAAQDWGSADTLSHEDITGPRVVEAFDAWFMSRSGAPFFAFVHLWDTHYDFIPPPPYDSMFGEVDPVVGKGLSGMASIRSWTRLPESELEQLIALYDGEIAWTDHHVGMLLERIDAAGLRDDTIVVVTSDHGEEFFEHGRFGHQKELYDESVRVPLIVRYPGQAPPGRRVRAPVRLTDVAPTLVDLAGIEALPDVAGRSLRSAFSEQPDVARTAPSELVHPLRPDTRLAVRAAGWKVVLQRHPRGDMLAYWDLRSDPGEQNALPETAIPRAAREALQATIDEMEALRRVHRLERSEGEQALTPGLRRQLEALGYLEPEGGDGHE